MSSGFGVDFKKLLEDGLAEEMTGYIEEKDLSDVLESPILGYASAHDKRFEDAYEEGLSMHPKEIYRPASTVIVSFLPYNKEYVKDNFVEGDENVVSKAWITAYEKSIIVSSHINSFIQSFLSRMGREVSLANIHTDWNKDTFRPEWSHKLAAHIAGMGEFGPSSSIQTKIGPWGRFNSVITEAKYEPSGEFIPITDESEKTNIIKDYLSYSLFENAKQVPEKIISACPCNAISDSGIDQAKCQEFCYTIDEFVPGPDACGRCYK